MSPLSVQQITDLTGRVMPSAQARELEHMGVKFTKRRDGSLLVLEENARKVLTGSGASATLSSTGPDFGALNRRR